MSLVCVPALALSLTPVRVGIQVARRWRVVAVVLK